MAKNDNLTDFVTDIADTLRTALKQDSTHKINPQDFSGIITDIANGSAIETEDVTITPSETVQEVSRTEGKYINKVIVNPIQTESLDVVPTQSSQAIQSPEGKYYKEVNVGAVTSAIDSNITPTNIRAGVSILGVQGNLEPDKPNQTKTVDSSTETQVVTADTGYELESVTVNAVTSSIDSNITPENIRKDTTILGVTGTLEEGGGKASPEYVSFQNYSGTNLDLSWLDTSNMTNMKSMFYYCNSLTALDVSGLNTSNVTNMQSMFNNCSSLTSIDVSNFNTSSVTDMSNMFYSCKSLNSLNLSNFDTSKVTNMSYMFHSCWAITNINISNFNTSNVTNMGNMIFYSYNLKTVNGTIDMQNVTNARDMLEYCSALEEVHIHNLGIDLKLSNSPKLTHDCLVELINNLQTVTSTKTLTLGSTNLAKLTDEEKQVATNKGWTLA